MAELTDGRFARPVRRGQVVERSAPHGSKNVAERLTVLTARCYRYSPRHLGFTADGETEKVTFIDGEADCLPLEARFRSDAALVQVVRGVRASGTATSPRGTSSSTVIVWPESSTGTRPVPRHLPGPGLSGRAVRPLARPHDDGGLSRRGWQSVPNRSQRLRTICSAYGDDLVDRAGLVDLAVVRLTAIAAHIEEHAEEGHGRGYREAAASSSADGIDG